MHRRKDSLAALSFAQMLSAFLGAASDRDLVPLVVAAAYARFLGLVLELTKRHTPIALTSELRPA